jgi:hypothetical protein
MGLTTKWVPSTSRANWIRALDIDYLLLLCMSSTTTMIWHQLKRDLPYLLVREPRNPLLVDLGSPH